jgi:hypothetical protein
VLVSGVDPLRVYIHEEGLTRLSTSDYALDNIDNKFAHLTNYSINKKAELFKTAPVDGAGSDTDGFKWSLAAFRKWLALKESPEIMMRTMDRINDLCLKTMIAAESEITPNLHTTANYRTNCFELFGCDVMLDSKLTPHLLEVNVSPSLMGSSPLDKKIKGILVADIFHTVGFYPHDPLMLRKFDSETMRTAADDMSPRSPTDRSISKEKLSQSGFHSTTRGAVNTKENKNIKESSNPFAFNSLTKMINSQESWRRAPKPKSIDFSAVAASESSWLLLLMAEDEFARSRSTHFTLVHPTQATAERYLGLYRNHRFSDHLLARWVSEGGFNGPLRRYIPTRYDMLFYSSASYSTTIAMLYCEEQYATLLSAVIYCN